MAIRPSGTGGGYALGDVLRLNVFTLSCWVYGYSGDPLAAGHIAGRKTSDLSSSMQYALWANGGLALFAGNHNSQPWPGNAFQAWTGGAGAWYHLYGTHDGSTLFASLKQLGGSQGTASDSFGTIATDIAGEFTIGDTGGNDFTYINGAIAEVAVWNVVLNANELAALDQRASPMRVRPQSLLSYIPCYNGAAFEASRATSPSRQGAGASQRFSGSAVDIGRHAPVAR